ncbi:MAG: ABC transporter ATP-binding protein, partial [Methylobacteriaceae bacterium]|nr:ABC transporter ATP-binding protein [Methylobacteriaceae bacterium]
LDEPLGALDLKLRKQMQVELSRIQREVGITFIYVTHDQEEALAMSDRIAVMDRGAVVQVGMPQDVYERPANLFVADFIGSSNKFPGRVLESTGGSAMIELDGAARVLAATPHRLAAGAPAVVVVRPDHVVISKPGGVTGGAVALSGRVVKAAYLGTHLQIEVMLPDGRAVTVRQSLAPGERRQAASSAGDDVVISWPAAQSIGFSQEELVKGVA